MALSDGIHPRSFSGEVTTYFTAGFSQLNEHTYKSGTFRGNVTKSPFSRRFKMIFPLFSRRVFSKLKRLGQKQDKRGDPAVRYQYNNTLNREKRAAKIAARFLIPRFPVLFWTHLNYNLSQIPKLIARVRYNHRKRLSTKGAGYISDQLSPSQYPSRSSVRGLLQSLFRSHKSKSTAVASRRTIRNISPVVHKRHQSIIKQASSPPGSAIPYKATQRSIRPSQHFAFRTIRIQHPESEEAPPHRQSRQSAEPTPR